MGCKLQEAAARYQSEGFSHIYIACTGTDTQKLMDLLETMFGDLDNEDLEPEQFESSSTKALHQEAAKAEEASVATVHGPISSDAVTHIMVISTPILIEFGIPEASIPETKNIKMPSAKNPAKRVTCFYYGCRVCSHSSQNKVSMMTHTQRCLHIKLVCKICKKENESLEGIKNHIGKMHKGNNDLAVSAGTEMLSD